jgi:hypothetical protein
MSCAGDAKRGDSLGSLNRVGVLRQRRSCRFGRELRRVLAMIRARLCIKHAEESGRELTTGTWWTSKNSFHDRDH